MRHARFTEPKLLDNGKVLIKIQIFEEVSQVDEEGNEQRVAKMVDSVHKTFSSAAEIDVAALEQEALQRTADTNSMIDKLQPLLGRKIVDLARGGKAAKRRLERVEKLNS